MPNYQANFKSDVFTVSVAKCGASNMKRFLYCKDLLNTARINDLRYYNEN